MASKNPPRQRRSAATRQDPAPPSNDPGRGPTGADGAQTDPTQLPGGQGGQIDATDPAGAGYDARPQDAIPAPLEATDQRRGLDSLRTQRLYTAQHRYYTGQPVEGQPVEDQP